MQLAIHGKEPNSYEQTFDKAQDLTQMLGCRAKAYEETSLVIQELSCLVAQDKTSQLPHTTQNLLQRNWLYMRTFFSILHSHYMISKLVDHTVDEQTIEQTNWINLTNMKVSKRKIGNQEDLVQKKHAPDMT